MAINFPDSPSTNDTYTVNGRTYIWNGEKWLRAKPELTSVVPTLTISNDLTVDTDTLYIDSTNNRVGVGTSSPSVSFDVEGAILGKSISTSSDAVLNLKGAYSQLQLTDTDDSTYMHYSYSGGKTIHRYNDYTNNVVFTIDGANSRVGVNTDTPLGDLSISGPGGREISFLDSGITNVAEMRAHAIGNTAGYAFMQYNAYDHRFAVEGTEVVRVNNNGFLDVDTTIDFTGTTASDGNVLMSFPHSYALYVDNTGAGTNNTRVWLDGPNGGEVILGPRTGANSFGSMRLRSTTIQNEGKTFFGDHLQTGQYSFTQEPWASSTIALGNYGYVGTAGSYGTSLMWNWERGPDSGYYSLGVNSYNSAAGIHMRNDGIRFQYESSWGATSEPANRALIDANGINVYGQVNATGNVYGNKVYVSSQSATPSTGWYTIAACSSGRASGLFNVHDPRSSYHEGLSFYVSHHYGRSSITILNYSYFSAGGPITQIRVRGGGTYDGAAVQVYFQATSGGCEMYLSENYGVQSWVTKNFIADGTAPGTVSGTWSSMTSTQASINMGAGTGAQPRGSTFTTGNVNGASKPFAIPHPTLGEDYTLRHCAIEGPENAVYHRGKCVDGTIVLPDYWDGLVDLETISVQLTPIGDHRNWIESIDNRTITVGGLGECFYVAYGERKDIPKIVVESYNYEAPGIVEEGP